MDSTSLHRKLLALSASVDLEKYNLKQKQEAVHKQINDYFDEIISELQQRKESLIKEADKLFSQQLAQAEENQRAIDELYASNHVSHEDLATKLWKFKPSKTISFRRPMFHSEKLQFGELEVSNEKNTRIKIRQSLTHAETEFILLSCGSNQNGQIGQGEIKGVNQFQAVQMPKEYRVLELYSTSGPFSACLAENINTFKTSILVTGSIGKQHHKTFKPIDDFGNETIVSASGASRGLVVLTGSNDFRVIGTVGNISNEYVNAGEFKGKVKTFKCGNDHCIILSEDGLLYGFGNSGHGRLTNVSLSTSINQIKSLEIINVKKLYVNYDTTVYITNDNQVYGFGANNANMLGGNDNYVTPPRRLQFTSLENDEHIVDVAVSYSQAFYLSNHNRLFFSGLNDNDDVKLGDSANVKEPTLLSDCIPKEMASSVIYGLYSPCSSNIIVRTLGDSLWALGKNKNSELGLGAQKYVRPFTLIPITKPERYAIRSISCSFTGICVLLAQEGVDSMFTNKSGSARLPFNISQCRYQDLTVICARRT